MARRIIGSAAALILCAGVTAALLVGAGNEMRADAANAMQPTTAYAAVRAPERALPLSLLHPMERAVKRAARGGVQLAADEGCTDALPYACNGPNMCCDSPSIYYCGNYQGTQQPRGASGCIKAGSSDEAIKDYSVSCTTFVAC